MHKGKRPYITCALFSGFRKRGHNMRKEIGVISFVTRQNRWQWCWGLGASLLILLENRVTKKSHLTQLTLKKSRFRTQIPQTQLSIYQKNSKHNQYAINNQKIGKFEEKRTNWVPEEIEESEGALDAAGAASPLGTVDS